MSDPIPEAAPVLSGRRVHRIHWVLGTDRLRAVCHCGAEQIFDDPVPLWEWLLGHPVGHDVPAADPPREPSGTVREPVPAG